jgi:hypothetical protein
MLLLLTVWRTYYILLLLLLQACLMQRPSQSLHGSTHNKIISQARQSAEASGSSSRPHAVQQQGFQQVKGLGSSCHAAAAAPAAAAALRTAVVCAAASVTAGGVPSSDDGLLLHPYQQQQQQQWSKQQAAAVAGGRPGPKAVYRVVAAVRKASSNSQLLGLLQDCSRDQITADLIKAVLFQASRIARSAAAAKSSSSSSSSSRGSEKLAAQQLVCACLQLLLEVNEQISGWHLANCLLSLGVLCGRGGPAAPVMAGAAAAAAAGGSMLASEASLQQQKQKQTAGVLQQLINPARSSRRDLEALLQATGPQYQLQQLLHLTRSTAITAAQPRQLVDMLYGLAVLPLRPAPEVLSLMLQGLQDQFQVMRPAAAAAVGDSKQHRPAAAAAAGEGGLTPKQLSQLLWSAATLQVHLSDGWLEQFCAASHGVLQLYGAQVRVCSTMG